MNEYDDFNTEYYKLSESSKINLLEIKRLIVFMKIFVDNFNIIIQNFKKQLLNNNELLYESILLTNMNGIYNYFLSIMDNSGNLISRIINDIISPLEQFFETQQRIYNDNLSRFNSLLKDYRRNKDPLEYSKINYYKSSFQYHNFDIENMKFYHVNKDLKDKLIQIKTYVNANKLLYKYEIEKFNEQIIKINNSYKILNEDIKMNEDSRISFIKASIDRYKIIYKDFMNGLNDFNNILENYFSNDICDKDKKYFRNQLTKYYKGNDNRIEIEKFISYKDFIKNQELKKNYFEFLFDENKLFPLLKGEEENNFSNIIINELLNINEIKSFHITQSLELMKNPQSHFSQKLLDNFLDRKKISSSLKFTNLKNMEHFSNILSFISIINNNVNNPNFKINFKIIFLAERIFYQNKNTGEKIYLCAQLSKNKYYRTKLFWENVIELKLANKLEDHIERLKNVILPEEKNSKGSFFGKLGFGNKNDIHKTSIVGINKISQLLKNYNSIESTKVPIIDRMAINELILIIKDNIPSFCNFNFYPDECLEMITEFARKYNINKEFINYFYSYFNVSNFTVRNLLSGNKDISNKKFFLFKNDDIEKRNILLFRCCLEYLNKSDYYNLILLSKNIKKKIMKKIYKIILKTKNISNKTRINIWKNILSINDLKKKYKYEEILNSPSNDKVKNDIKLDVLRTNFKNENNEEIKKKISNILNAVSKLNGDIKYCQGMNYIVSFILEITNEEEAFYIFLSFFKSTEYPIIFDKDLEKLKIFFYIFQRLISLIEPELSIYFNSNSINANIFLPPWFITLFLSSRQFMNQNETPISLIRILDNFIVSGWKSLMKVGIFILHCVENDIYKFQNESLLSYLINDIKKYDLFCDNKINELEKCFNDSRITKRLIKFIEEEYRQEKKLKDIKI